MKHIYTLLILSIILLPACKRSKNSSILENRWKIENLSSHQEVFLDGDSTQKGMQLDLNLEYPSKIENDSLTAIIKSNLIFAFAGEEYMKMNIAEAFDAFIKKNIEESTKLGELASKDGPDFSDYFRKISTQIVDTNNIYLTAKTYYEDYAGGAHGSHRSSYYNIDLNSGNILNQIDLLKEDMLDSLAVLIKNELKDTTNTNKYATILDWDVVNPNNNFRLDKEGITYVFNESEIAPYSDGTIEVLLPYSKLQGMTTPKLDEIISIKTKTE